MRHRRPGGLLRQGREILIDEQGVVAKFGVQPESIPDYLALVGDTADGVPGIPGWGAALGVDAARQVREGRQDPRRPEVGGSRSVDGPARCLVGRPPRGRDPVPHSDHAAAGCPARRVAR